LISSQTSNWIRARTEPVRGPLRVGVARVWGQVGGDDGCEFAIHGAAAFMRVNRQNPWVPEEGTEIHLFSQKSGDPGRGRA